MQYLSVEIIKEAVTSVTVHTPAKEDDMISVNVSEAEPLPLSCITHRYIRL